MCQKATSLFLGSTLHEVYQSERTQTHNLHVRIHQCAKDNPAIQRSDTVCYPGNLRGPVQIKDIVFFTSTVLSGAILQTVMIPTNFLHTYGAILPCTSLIELPSRSSALCMIRIMNVVESRTEVYVSFLCLTQDSNIKGQCVQSTETHV
jgi:hypothetical protein